MMRKNKKAGFTLLELLAVLVILGIIVGISLPLIRRIQDENKQKKFETYSDSVKYSAKLYMNSYEEDLFGDSKSGCYILRYKEMKERNLLKDIDVDNVSCESDFTYVRVVKVNERYAYTPSLFCINKSTNKEEYSTKTSQMMTCPDNGMATITIDPPGAEKYVKGLNNIQVFVSSPMGFYPYDVSLEYAFSTTKNEANIMGSWSPLKFNVPSEDEQMEMIDNGDVVITSNSLSTPAGYNGDVYLLVRIIHLEDLARSDWSSLEGKIEKSDAYWLDNTKPTGEIKVATVSAPKGERNVTVELKDNFKLNEYYYKTTYPSGNVTYTKINNAGGQHSFNTTVKENGVGTYYLKVLDSAGNESNVVSKTFYRTTFNTVEGTLKNGFVSKVVSIENEPFALPDAEKAGNTFEGWYDSLTGGNLVGKAGASYTPTATKTLYARWSLNKYTLTYYVDGHNCTGTITRNKNEAWGTLCTPQNANKGTFLEWNTDYYGNGTTITASSKATSNITVYAQWKPNAVSYSLGCTNYPQDCSQFQNDSWSTIVQTVKSEAGTNKTSYPVGCTKSVYLSGFGWKTLRIANNSNYNCSTSSKTACGFVLEFTNSVTAQPYNSNNSAAGGWPSSEIRNYVNSTIYYSIPDELRSGIIYTSVKSGGTTGIDSSSDYLYLLDVNELYKNGWTVQAGSVNRLGSGTRQLDYYSCEGVEGASSLTSLPGAPRASDDNEICFLYGASVKFPAERCSMQPLCSACRNLTRTQKDYDYWWLRSVNAKAGADGIYKQFWAVNNGIGPVGSVTNYTQQSCACFAGTASTRSAVLTFGISPAFRLA